MRSGKRRNSGEKPRLLSKLAAEIEQEFFGLSLEDRAAALRCLENLAFEEAELFEEYTVPVGPAEFFGSTYFMGKDTLWPVIKDDLIEFFEGKYVEALITGGKRSGKSYFTVGALKYMIYLVSRFVSPQTALNIAPTSHIYGINLSIGGYQAQRGIYSELRASLEETPYFQSDFAFQHRILTELVFPKRFVYTHGSGLSTKELGLNVIFGCYDEVNSVRVIENSRRSMDATGEFHQVKSKYEILCRRARETALSDVQTKMPFRMLALGSREYEGDFMESRIAQFENDPQTFIRFYDAVHTRPRSHFKKSSFLVDLGGPFDFPRVIASAEEARGELLELPEDYSRDASTDITGLLRDVMGVVKAPPGNLFFENSEYIQLAFRRPESSHIFSTPKTDASVSGMFLLDKICVDGKVERGLLAHPKVPRFVHIDMALNSDDIGIAMGCCGGWKTIIRRDDETMKEVTEYLPETYIDFMLQVVPGGKDVSPAKIRNLIIRLRDIGYNIQLVSGDQYAFSSLIELRDSQFKVDKISAEDMGTHLRAKTAFYDRRVDAYRHEVANRQLLGMRISNDRKKILKPSSGINSGVENAVVAVIWAVNEFSKRSAQIAPSVTTGLSAQQMMLRQLRSR